MALSTEVVSTDYLVIGSGVAGLRAAIELAGYGEVLVVTKDKVSESSTEYAQGGVAVALSDEDEIGFHFKDTIEAGDGLCDEGNVSILVAEGPERVKELISWGARFDKEGSRLAFTREAAHSQNRILHAHGDSTGKEIVKALLAKVKTMKGVTKYDHSFTVDLIVKDGRAVGALALKERGRKLVAIYAKAVVLATGGLGQVFQRTTNPMVATGDGMAIAYRAGATMVDMEFVQFHPTSLFAPLAPQFLLSEAMRGEGGLLLNVHGEQFMKNYHPKAELAPRDVVSRSIVSEMVKTHSDHVLLDLRHLGPQFVKSRFPRIYSTCLTYDKDISEELIPVSPAAHYMMGGVRTDAFGATDLPGLFAAGEVACTGVHGANRLASNSLLEGIVFGARAGAAAGEYGRGEGLAEGDRGQVEFEEGPGPKDTVKARISLRRLMWAKVGIIRCGISLGEAVKGLERLAKTAGGAKLSRPELELRNMVTVSSLIAGAAMDRQGSVGAHFRSDMKARGRNWKRHITLRKA